MNFAEHLLLALPKAPLVVKQTHEPCAFLGIYLWDNLVLKDPPYDIFHTNQFQGMEKSQPQKAYGEFQNGAENRKQK